MCESLCDRSLVTIFFVDGVGTNRTVHYMSSIFTCEYLVNVLCIDRRFVMLVHLFEQFMGITCALHRLLWWTDIGLMTAHCTIDRIYNTLLWVFA